MVYLYSRPEARDMQFVLNRADSQVMLSIIRSSYSSHASYRKDKKRISSTKHQKLHSRYDENYWRKVEVI